MQIEITTEIILLGGVIAAVVGAVANKTNFCTMGAVSDWINMRDSDRMRAWFMAIALAILGVALLELFSVVDLATSRTPYRGSTLFWPRNILGGLMFGVGMTLASGCGYKNLVNVGGGSIRAIIVVLVTGVMAYLMIRTDLYRMLFHGWMAPISPDLVQLGIPDQGLGTFIGVLTGMQNPDQLTPYLGLLVAFVILLFIFRSKAFRTNINLLLSGFVVGLAIVAGWYITGGPMGAAWMEAVDFMDQPPPGTGTQSLTFISPMSETLVYLADPGDMTLITFGVAALFGIIVGSFIYAIISRRFKFEWFVNLKDFFNHIVGAALMGIGGVLAMGCTIGQGVTGVSTLAIGSFLALGSIILGSALTIKIQYYKLVYAAEASFDKALITSLVDLHILPEGMRKLEAI